MLCVSKIVQCTYTLLFVLHVHFFAVWFKTGMFFSAKFCDLCAENGTQLTDLMFCSEYYYFVLLGQSVEMSNISTCAKNCHLRYSYMYRSSFRNFLKGMQ